MTASGGRPEDLAATSAPRSARRDPLLSPSGVVEDIAATAAGRAPLDAAALGRSPFTLEEDPRAPVPPALSLPTGGGALRGLAEVVSTTATGTATLTVPLGLPPGRDGFGPALALGYSSAAGNGPYGLGWGLGLGGITLRTEQGVPHHEGTDEVLLGATPLVHRRDGAGRLVETTRTVHGTDWAVTQFRPRLDQTHARVERWRSITDASAVRWRVIDSSNVTTWYGRDVESRIADPTAPHRIAGWLPSLAHDDRGNAVRYRYRAEDSTGVDVDAPHEAGRSATARTANRYLHRVDYGNRTPYRPVLSETDAPTAEPHDWTFHLVLDHGDHRELNPGLEPDQDWPVRPDPWSSHRTGFEVRTYRRCRRLLVFHAFPELGPDPVLTTTTTLHHSPTSHGLSLLTGVTRTGHDDGSSASLPTLEVAYTEWAPAGNHETVDLGELDGNPIGLDGAHYEWVDLDGDGAPGICIRTPAQGWFHKRNLGPLGPAQPGTPRARFAGPVPLPDIPLGVPTGGPVGLPSAWSAFVDVDGDGRADLLVPAGPQAGVARRSGRSWQALHPFAATPVVPGRNLTDAGPTALVDLTGDGRPDLLVGDGLAARWHRGLGLDGFAAARSVQLAAAEADEPVLLHTAEDRVVLLADLDGDGLPDLVEITRTAVRYRPSLGHGRFGPCVQMDDAPTLDTVDGFDPRRVLLADVDGDGCTDLVYLGARHATLHHNRHGNGWAPPRDLTGTPGTDQLTQAAVVDLFGQGTGALVWSTRAPQADGRPLRYVDLAPAGKPYLMRHLDNGRGATIDVEYTPSTTFALLDELAGDPWPSPLPFPVHCASRVTTVDGPRGTTFTTTTSYHLGHYDGVEREFMGFGRVDTRDAEEHVDGPRDSPPVLVRRWYHTGHSPWSDHRRRADGDSGGGGGGALHTHRHQYAAVDGPVLPEPDLPDLDPVSLGHLLRALAGVELRAETFAEDGGPLAAMPYTVTERTVDLRLLQPAHTLPATTSGDARLEPPVAQVLPAGAVGLTCERDPSDPRVTQHLVLATDDLGCVTASATVVHPRRSPDPALPAEVTAAQQRPVVSCSTAEYTDDVLGADTHRLRATARTRGWEVTGFDVGGGTAVVATDLLDAFDAATELDPDQVDPPPGLHRRLLGAGEARFLDDALTADLPAGSMAAHGVVGQTYRLVLTAAMAATRFGGVFSDAELTAAGYVHLDGDADWWVPSGRALYPASPADHFLLPDRVTDALGTTTAVERLHDLLVTAVVDARGHRTTASYDLRRISPTLVTDSSGNRSACLLDPLGGVTALAAMGSEGLGEGDTLADPTVRHEYDLDRWRTSGLPAVVRSFAREQHGLASTPWQESRTYLDGHGAVLAMKQQAAPGPARHLDPATGDVTTVDTSPDLRWVGTGRTVLNSKGLPVKVYEPYYSDTAEFDSAAVLVEAGVSSVMHYDPVGRGIRVEHPDGTLERVDIHTWHTVSHDAVDTVLDSTWYAERGTPPPTAPEPTDPQERAAWLAARSAGTPAQTHIDPLGRPMLQVLDNGGGDVRGTTVRADVGVLHGEVRDTWGRLVLGTTSDLLGRVIVTDCAERGRSLTLVDVLGGAVTAVDALGRRATLQYDDLHRAVRVLTQEPGGTQQLTTWVRYGDDLPGAADRNAVGRIVSVLDESGRVDIDGYDFTGAPTGVTRRFRTAALGLPDWTAVAEAADPDSAAAALLQPESWHGSATQDALGRPTRIVLAEGTVLLPTFDEGDHLATLDVQPGGQGPTVRVLAGQDHDAAGRAVSRDFGNGLRTEYGYDELSRRLTTMMTGSATRPALQDMTYTYDPAGHLTEVDDASQQTHFFDNAVVGAGRRFTYDALYQLVAAEGRELAALGRPGHEDAPGRPLPHPNDTHAVRRYRQEFTYDEVGNLTDIRHRASPAGWRRRFRHAHDSDPTSRSNRLLATQGPGDPQTVLSATFGYDAIGNLTHVPHLTSLSWDLLGRLTGVDLGGGGSATYGYGVGGGRVRKVVNRGALVVETLYLGGAEVVREWLNGSLHTERRTLMVGGENGRLAQVDRITVAEGTEQAGDPVVRYVHHDQLGSVTVLTNEGGDPVSHEEFHPYGTTAYRSSAPGEHVSLRRYRFLDRERDDETGFCHLGGRLYAPWLGRWISPDPAGYVDGANLYRYARGCPSTLADPTGTDSARKEFAIPPELNTPAAVEEHLKDSGFDFTGPVTRLPNGNWDIGTWLRIPGEGDGPADGTDGSDADDAAAQTTDGGDGGEGGPPADGTDDGTADGSGSVGDTGGGETPEETGTGEQDGAGIGRGDDNGASHAGEVSTAPTHAGPAAERFIWDYEFPGTGPAGTQRGRILETMMGVPWRDNTKGVDRVRGGAAQQIKTTESYSKVAAIARAAVRDADAAVKAMPNSGNGLRPQAVIVTRTDAPASVDDAIAGAHGRGKVPANALPPEHVRGLPGPVGHVGRSLTFGGAGLSGYALYDDIMRGDVPMAIGDGLSTIGGALELYALASPGATVAGASAVSAGLVVGGIGLAVASGISSYRSFRAGDTAGGVVGLAGVAAGLAIAIGVVAGAPLVLAAGIIGAIGVGIFHVGRWLDFW